MLHVKHFQKFLIQDLDCGTAACNEAAERTHAVLFDADGKLVVTGYHGVDFLDESSIPAASTVRYTSSGSLDTLFAGSDGIFRYVGPGIGGGGDWSSRDHYERNLRDGPDDYC